MGGNPQESGVIKSKTNNSDSSQAQNDKINIICYNDKAADNLIPNLGASGFK